MVELIRIDYAEVLPQLLKQLTHSKSHTDFFTRQLSTTYHNVTIRSRTWLQ